MSSKNINLDDINHITLDLSIHRIVNVICKQDDANTRKLFITLTNNGEEFLIDSTIKVKYKLCKADNTYVYNNADEIIDGKIYIDLTEQCSAFAGIARSELQLIRYSTDTEPGQVISSMPFHIIVQESAVSNSTIESSNEFGVLNKIITEFDGFTDLKEIDAVLTADAWRGDSAPYTQTLTIDDRYNINGYVNCSMNLNDTATPEQSYAAINARLREAVITYDKTGGFTFTINGIKPAIDIPITILTGQALNVTEVPAYVQNLPVVGIKGNAERDYRIGNVNLTPENLGAASAASPVFSGSISMGRTSETTVGTGSAAIGSHVTASGNCAQAFGYDTTASGDYSHAIGYSTTASGDYSHAEGSNNSANGSYSHAEGSNNSANGDYSHTEGYNNTSSGKYTHVEGVGHDCTLSYEVFIELDSNINIFSSSLVPTTNATVTDIDTTICDIHYTKQLNFAGTFSYIDYTLLEKNVYHRGAISGQYFFDSNALFISDGYAMQILLQTEFSPDSTNYFSGTAISEKYFQLKPWTGNNLHIQGSYSNLDSEDYIHVVGNGSSSDARSNAHTLDKYGNAYFAGDVTGTNKNGDKISLSNIHTNLKNCAKISTAPTITLFDSTFSITANHIYKVENIIFFHVNLSSSTPHTGSVIPISITDSDTIAENQILSASGSSANVSSASSTGFNIPLPALVASDGKIYINTSETFYHINISGTIITS